MRLFLSLSSREIGKKLIKKTFIYVTFFRDRGVIGETIPVLWMTDDIFENEMRDFMKKRVVVFLLLFCLAATACSKPAEKPAEVPEENDWRDRYGTTLDGTVTPEPDKPTKTPKPTGFDISSIELPYPTPLPVREFVPEEGQIELVLWMFGDHDRILDDHIVA